MAFIKTEDVKKIRLALKEEFGKDYKFSVKKMSSMSGVHVSVLESKKVNFKDIISSNVNTYYIDDHYVEDQAKVLTKILEIIKTAPSKEYFDKSCSFSDYTHVAYYYDISIGSTTKDFKFTGEEV